MPSPRITEKRPVAVTSVTLLQFLLGFLWLGITIYLLVLSRSAEMKGYDSGAAVRGLEIAAAIVSPGAIFGLIAAYALRKDKVWGWWLSLIVNAAFAALLIYSMIDEGWRGGFDLLVAFTLLPLLLVILLLLPVVREFYWRKPSTVKSEEPVS